MNCFIAHRLEFGYHARSGVYLANCEFLLLACHNYSMTLTLGRMIEYPPGTCRTLPKDLLEQESLTRFDKSKNSKNKKFSR
jgi:hypothetical protein